MASLVQKICRRLRFKFIDGPRGKGTPVPPETWDQQYRSGFWGKLEGPEEMAHYAVIAGYLSYTGPQPSVLDIGCGQGHLARHVARMGISRYLGVDLSAAAITQAEEMALGHSVFEVGDFNHWLPTESFDVIIFNESIYYAPDPTAVLQAYLPFARKAIIISMCEYANHSVIWKKFGTLLKESVRSRIENERGQVWNVRLYLQGDPAASS